MTRNRTNFERKRRELKFSRSIREEDSDQFTDEELAELEKLMKIEKALIKRGEKLPLKEKIRFFRLKNKFKNFIEGSKDFSDDEDLPDYREYAKNLYKYRRELDDQIKQERKRASYSASRRVREEDDITDDGIDDEFDDGVDVGGGSGEESESDGLSINIQFPPGYEVPSADEIQTEAEPLTVEGGEEDSELAMESVRRRARIRRERLAKIRARRYSEEDTPAVGEFKGYKDYIDDLYKEIGSKSENISEKIKWVKILEKKLGMIKRDLESKIETFDDGVIDDGEPSEEFMIKEPKKFPEHVRRNMTEKLNWDKLLKRGILG